MLILFISKSLSPRRVSSSHLRSHGLLQMCWVGRALFRACPTGACRLGFQHSTHQQWHKPGGRRTQKWLPPKFQSLERVPAVSCLSSRCCKVSKWVSIPYGLCAFLSDVFVLASRLSVCASHLRAGFYFPAVV